MTPMAFQAGGTRSAHCDQGGIESPIIFNLIIDTVLQKLREEEEFGGSNFSFYADDGLLESEDSEGLQRDTDRVI